MSARVVVSLITEEQEFQRLQAEDARARPAARYPAESAIRPVNGAS